MALSGQVCVIAESSGAVGAALVEHFLAEGAVVVAPCASLDIRAKLLSSASDICKGVLEAPVCDCSSAAGATALATYLETAGYDGKLAHVVAVTHVFDCPDVIDATSKAAFATAVQSKTVPQQWLAQALLPICLAVQGSTFTVLTCPPPPVSKPRKFPVDFTALANATVHKKVGGLVRVLQSRRAAAGLEAPRVHDLQVDASAPELASPQACAAFVAGAATSGSRNPVIRMSPEQLAVM